MATFYYPDADGFDPNIGGKRWSNSLMVYLDGGTGGATATVEALVLGSWQDVTEIYGIAQFSVSAGSTGYKALLDGGHRLNHFPRVRLHVEADDASKYNVELRRS